MLVYDILAHQIKRYPCAMISIQQLLKDLIQLRKSVIVFGFLGRKPSLLRYYLDLLFDHLNIQWESGIECDLFIWLEPTFETIIEKNPYAKQQIVFTSHLNLIYSLDVVGYHVENIPFHFETIYNELIHKKTIGNISNLRNKKYFVLYPDNYREIPKNSRIVVYLLNCKDSHTTYIQLLNVFENLLAFNDHIISWELLLNNCIPFKQDMVACKQKIKNVKYIMATTRDFDKLCKYHFLNQDASSLSMETCK